MFDQLMWWHCCMAVRKGQGHQGFLPPAYNSCVIKAQLLYRLNQDREEERQRGCWSRVNKSTRLLSRRCCHDFAEVMTSQRHKIGLCKTSRYNRIKATQSHTGWLQSCISIRGPWTVSAGFSRFLLGCSAFNKGWLTELEVACK